MNEPRRIRRIAARQQAQQRLRRMLAARRKSSQPSGGLSRLPSLLLKRRALYVLGALALVVLIAVPTFAPGTPPAASPDLEPTAAATTPVPTATPSKTVAGPPPVSLAPEGTYSAVIQTAKGSIRANLYTDAPAAANNFIYLSKQSYYNGLSVYSAVQGQRVEAGAVNEDGTGGPGYTIPAEPSGRVPQIASLALLPEPDGSLGSRFAIVLTSQALPPGAVVIGQVTDGMDVARQLGKGDRISSIRIVEPGQ